MTGHDLVWWCQSCRSLRMGVVHCSDPINCGGMQQLPREEVEKRYAALATRADEEPAK